MSQLSDTATFRRAATTIGLVVAAWASAVSVVMQPPFPVSYTARLAAMHDAGAAAAFSAALFTSAQLPMLAAVLGIAHLLRRGAPVLSNLGGLLGVVGSFGHAVFGGVALVTVVMAADPAHRSEYAALWRDVESSPVMIFAALGLLGTVLGLLLLGIGLWRSRVVARWVPVTLWVFLVVEFVGAGLSSYAAFVSALCFLAAFTAIARQVWTSPAAAWSAPELAAGHPDPVST